MTWTRFFLLMGMVAVAPHFSPAFASGVGIGMALMSFAAWMNND